MSHATCDACGWDDPAIHAIRALARPASRLPRRSTRPYEDEYVAFRSALLVEACRADGAGIVLTHAEGLAVWLDDHDHAAWARDTPQGQCGFHADPHSVLRCLTDELAYWQGRANGMSEREARKGASDGTEARSDQE